MFIKHNYLRLYRKKSYLTQSDLIFILGVKDNSLVCRWEQGERKPDVYTLLGYHLLFDIPIELMFDRQRSALIERLSQKIKLRIDYLKSNQPDGTAVKRIEYLHNILSRLISPPSSV
jgi:transcriptional regulator with XRE-family HTH domain